MEASAQDRARLFVALELPGPVRDALAHWRSEALGHVPGLRFPAAEQLHVTLCFLGWQTLEETEAIWPACSFLAGEPAAELRLGAALWLPSRRPRVLAVGLEDPDAALQRVQAALSRALAQGGWYRPEKRPFLAHATVARVGKGARLPARELSPPPALELRGSQITLFRSRLAPSGARYEPLESVELRAA